VEELSETAAANFESIERDLEQAWITHPEVPEAVRLQLAIAVSEVVGNIIEHGGGLQRPVHIQMQLTLSDHGQVQICFTDDGDELPADVDLSKRAMPDESAEGGRGIALALAVLEQLSYHRDNAINCWTLLSRRFNPFHNPPESDSTAGVTHG
jgi:serine/threonine-protein kinase RsbW